MKKIYLLISLIFLSSCSHYIDKMYRRLDREERRDMKSRRKHDKRFDFYKQKKSSPVNSSQKQVLLPHTKRNYQISKKRMRAEDLADNGNPASLWAGSEGSNFIFINKTRKKAGDLVLINVEKDLKNEITTELKRVFPSPFPLVSKKESKEKPIDQKNPSNGKAPVSNKKQSKAKIFDRISSLVSEEINQDHLLLKGRRFLVYKKRKRLIEIQALITRKDITEQNTITSSNIIESTIRIIR